MLQIRDLYKSYGETGCSNGVNLDVKRGETLVIMGAEWLWQNRLQLGVLIA